MYLPNVIVDMLILILVSPKVYSMTPIIIVNYNITLYCLIPTGLFLTNVNCQRIAIKTQIFGSYLLIMKRDRKEKDYLKQELLCSKKHRFACSRKT